jgi:NDP-sugar pyrophosphorylase family protein
MTTDSTSCIWQRDLLSPESFLLCCHELLTGRAGCWRGPSGDAPGSVIDPTARSESPPEGNVWLAERVEVGKNTVLRRSVLLPGARVGNRCDLDSVLVLPGASVGSGTDMSDKYLNVIGLEGG